MNEHDLRAPDPDGPLTDLPVPDHPGDLTPEEQAEAEQPLATHPDDLKAEPMATGVHDVRRNGNTRSSSHVPPPPVFSDGDLIAELANLEERVIASQRAVQLLAVCVGAVAGLILLYALRAAREAQAGAGGPELP